MKLIDNAYDVLRGEPTITQDQRADLHDLFHTSANATELAGHLSQLPQLHPDLVSQLIHAKSKPSVELDAVDKVVGAIHKMGALDPKLLELAESHPHVFQAHLDQLNQKEQKQ